MTAYHEAGHAVAAFLVRRKILQACIRETNKDPSCHIPDRSLGVVNTLDQDLHTPRYVRASILIALGGIVADLELAKVDGTDRPVRVHLDEVQDALKEARTLPPPPSSWKQVPWLSSIVGPEDADILTPWTYETRDLISAHGPAVEALAQALLVQRCLSGR